uniref:hypothetical protein n=1 Tax=Thaumasiovibrio subtropicus TaxID=1891207 RepID=UPI000B3569D1
MIEQFTNRDFALLFSIGAFLVFMAMSPKLRKLFYVNLIYNCILKTQIKYLLLFCTLYTLVCVIILDAINFWTFHQVKNTIYWFFGFLLANIGNIFKNEKISHRKIAIQNCKALVILQIWINTHAFSFFAELLLLTSISFIVLLKHISEKEEENKKVTQFIEWILATLGIFIISASSINTLQHYQKVLTPTLIQDFLTPILLSIMAIPLFKLIVVYGTYEQTRTPFKGGLSSHICRVMAFTFFLCDTEKLNQWRYHLIRKNGEPGFIDSIVAINNVRKSYKILATEGTPPPNAWAPSKAAKFMATKGIIIDKYRLISGELWQGRYEKEFNEVHESYFIEGKE